MEEKMIIIYILVAILGLCVGSFLNVVIYRIPNNMNLAYPASHCPKCQEKIKWYDNIPVLSYIFLGGKCRHCKEKITVRYLLVEVLNALLWLLSAYVFWKESAVYSIVIMLVSSVLICITFIDIEHLIIYDRFQIMLLILAIIAIFFDKRVNLDSKLIGFIFGALFFMIMHVGAKVVLKKDGLGGGDVKLAAICGLLLGFDRGFVAIIIASVMGSVVLLIVNRIRKDKKSQEYPFAPFIVLGVMISLYIGQYICEWYLDLFI